MALRKRLEKLERALAIAARNFTPAFIAYTEGEKTKADAMAEWEAANGPLSECGVVFGHRPNHLSPFKRINDMDRTIIQSIEGERRRKC